MLPKMRRQAGDQLDRLGERFAQRKQRAMAGGGGAVDLVTKDELYQKAKEMDIPGRSSMTKDELAQAVRSGG